MAIESNEWIYEKSDTFTCALCGKTKPILSFTPGYGTNENGEKHCYDCCAKQDHARLVDASCKKVALYLVSDKDGRYSVTNWPGTLRIACVTYARKVFNPIGGRMERVDAWFTLYDLKGNAHHWHGVCMGDTQYILLKRNKHGNKSIICNVY